MEHPLPTPTTRAHVFVSGTVQGVGYRYSTMNYAKRFGVNGWVRNLADGRVEAVFEGSIEAVQSMISWCRIGPMGAVVKDVAIEYEEPEGDRRFEIRRF
ncbi:MULTISPECIES: acylphosphatase [Kamptonema]|uniref:acylphosphatase n=1 Tax=Kamptonema TaxID=1501433 RepID=UPI0001DACBC6|nr:MULTISPECIES: acylphosphatase [Kamptonema]CBN53935.1 Acylphosphatase [Kamptonema sp. PCC 6506]